MIQVLVNYDALNTKVNNLEKKTSDATALIDINQYNTKFKEKVGDVD